jgi:hypothetical protein
VTGHHDDRKGAPARLEPAQKLHSVDAGHAHIRDDAAGLGVPDLIEEGGCGFMQANHEAVRCQQEGQRFAHRNVIVDHMNDRVTRHAPSPPC